MAKCGLSLRLSSKVLAFLADDRLGCLFNPELQHLLLRVLFEPLTFFDARPYVEDGAVIVEAVPIPAKKRGQCCDCAAPRFRRL